MTNTGLMKVESFAEFCNTFDLIKRALVLKTNLWSFESVRFTQVLLYLGTILNMTYLEINEHSLLAFQRNFLNNRYKVATSTDKRYRG